MSAFWAECIGTAMIILLGNGDVANVNLKRTYANSSGWIVITFGWAIAVFVGVMVAAPHSGAHLNPAVSIALGVLGKISWPLAINYIIGQFLGAMIGSTLVYLVYRDHYESTEDRGAKMATFCTSPAIPNVLNNLLMEAVGTFVLIFAVLAQVGTGLFSADTDTGMVNGPLALKVADKWVERATDFHAWWINILLTLVAVHVAAVVLYLVWKRHNLIGPMITGRKRIDQAIEPGAPTPRLAFGSSRLAMSVLLACAALVYFIVRAGG